MSRGFLDKFGDRYRGRYVRSPYDARDLNVPRNQVLFDTDAIGTLSKLADDSFTFAYSGSLDVGPVKFASWPDPGFVPLCSFLFSVSGGPRDNAYTMDFASTANKNHRFVVSRTGITGSLALINSTAPVTVYWIAYRLAVV